MVYHMHQIERLKLQGLHCRDKASSTSGRTQWVRVRVAEGESTGTCICFVRSSRHRCVSWDAAAPYRFGISGGSR